MRNQIHYAAQRSIMSFIGITLAGGLISTNALAICPWQHLKGGENIEGSGYIKFSNGSEVSHDEFFCDPSDMPTMYQNLDTNTIARSVALANQGKLTVNGGQIPTEEQVQRLRDALNERLSIFKREAERREHGRLEDIPLANTNLKLKVLADFLAKSEPDSVDMSIGFLPRPTDAVTNLTPASVKRLANFFKKQRAAVGTTDEEGLKLMENRLKLQKSLDDDRAKFERDMEKRAKLEAYCSKHPDKCETVYIPASPSGGTDYETQRRLNCTSYSTGCTPSVFGGKN